MKKLIKSGEWQYHVLLLPALIAIFIFSYIPIYGICIAFQRYNPVMGFNSPWVGMQNFQFLFKQRLFLRSIRNSLSIASVEIVLGVVVPVAFALLLNEVKRSSVKRTIQTIVYLPHFLSWIILAGMFIDMLASEGLVNKFLGIFGMGPYQFLGDPKLFPGTMIVLDTWKGFGWGAIIYLAALTNIDPTLYEASAIDGANRWQQTVHITLAGIVPTIVLMSVLSIGGLLSANFDQIFNLYSPSVYSTGDIIDTYVYRLGFEQAQYSLSAAVGLFRTLVGVLLVGLSNWAAGRFANYRIF